MGDRAQCPGCDAYSSSVLSAISEGRACPFCGLSADAIRKVEVVRQNRADEALKADVERLMIENDKLKAEVRNAKLAKEEIEYALSQWIGPS